MSHTRGVHTRRRHRAVPAAGALCGPPLCTQGSLHAAAADAPCCRRLAQGPFELRATDAELRELYTPIAYVDEEGASYFDKNAARAAVPFGQLRDALADKLKGVHGCALPN